jgi:ATP synthase protein I
MAKRNGWKTTREEREDFRSGVDAATIGWFFFAAIGVGFLAGQWVDRRFHVEPWGMLVGVLLGMAAGFRNLIKVANRMSDEDRRKGKGP